MFLCSIFRFFFSLCVFLYIYYTMCTLLLLHLYCHNNANSPLMGLIKTHLISCHLISTSVLSAESFQSLECLYSSSENKHRFMCNYLNLWSWNLGLFQHVHKTCWSIQSYQTLFFIGTDKPLAVVNDDHWQEDKKPETFQNFRHHWINNLSGCMYIYEMWAPHSWVF